MISAAVLDQLRDLATSSFYDTCTFTRAAADDEREIDPESGEPIGEAPAPVTVYDGPCGVTDGGERVAREKGGRTDVGGEALVALPYGSGPFREDDTGVCRFGGVQRTCKVEQARHLDTQVRLLVTWTSLAEADE